MRRVRTWVVCISGRSSALTMLHQQSPFSILTSPPLRLPSWFYSPVVSHRVHAYNVVGRVLSSIFVAVSPDRRARAAHSIRVSIVRITICHIRDRRRMSVGPSATIFAPPRAADMMPPRTCCAPVPTERAPSRRDRPHAETRAAELRRPGGGAPAVAPFFSSVENEGRRNDRRRQAPVQGHGQSRGPVRHPSQPSGLPRFAGWHTQRTGPTAVY
jgi:hypothetical protein